MLKRSVYFCLLWHIQNVFVKGEKIESSIFFVGIVEQYQGSFFKLKIYKVAWNKSLLIELFVFEYSEFFIEFFDKKSLCLNVYSCYLKCSIQNEVCSCESEEDDGENSFVHFSVRILRLNLQFRETRTSQTATRFWIG